MKKTIAVVGAAGNAGSALAHGLAVSGYRVLLNDDIQTNPFLYAKLLLLEYRIVTRSSQADVTMVLSEKEACWEADIVILAVPLEEQPGIALKIKDVTTGKVVISTIDTRIQANKSFVTTPTSSRTEELLKLLPYSRIVTAFISTSGSDFKNPLRSELIMNALVDGDDPESVTTVTQILKDTGLNLLHAGSGSMGWRFPTLLPLEPDSQHRRAGTKESLGEKSLNDRAKP